MFVSSKRKIYKIFREVNDDFFVREKEWNKTDKENILRPSPLLSTKLSAAAVIFLFIY